MFINPTFALNKTIKKIVVLISGRGSNLQAIYHMIMSQKLPVEISLVISNRDDAIGLTFCQAQKIRTHIIDSKGKERSIFDSELVQVISAEKPDLIILAGFMRILTSVFIDAFPNKIINIHPSLLPKYKGLKTHQRALDAQDQITGASVHIVNADLDGGCIIAQIVIPIYELDTAETLATRLLPAEHILYAYVVKLWAYDILHFDAQGAYLCDQKLQSPLQLSAI